MADTTGVAGSTADLGAPQPTTPNRLNQALAWVGIVAGGLFVVGAIFFSGFFLNWSEHMHTHMGHAPMGHESKDCCADMKMGDMKPGDVKPGAMGPEMTGPHSGA